MVDTSDKSQIALTDVLRCVKDDPLLFCLGTALGLAVLTTNTVGFLAVLNGLSINIMSSFIYDRTNTKSISDDHIRNRLQSEVARNDIEALAKDSKFQRDIRRTAPKFPQVQAFLKREVTRLNQPVVPYDQKTEKAVLMLQRMAGLSNPAYLGITDSNELIPMMLRHHDGFEREEGIEKFKELMPDSKLRHAKEYLKSKDHHIDVCEAMIHILLDHEDIEAIHKFNESHPRNVERLSPILKEAIKHQSHLHDQFLQQQKEREEKIISLQIQAMTLEEMHKKERHAKEEEEKLKIQNDELIRLKKERKIKIVILTPIIAAASVLTYMGLSNLSASLYTLYMDNMWNPAADIAFSASGNAGVWVLRYVCVLPFLFVLAYIYPFIRKGVLFLIDRHRSKQIDR